MEQRERNKKGSPWHPMGSPPLPDQSFWRRIPLPLGPPPLHPRGCPCRRNPPPLGSPPPGSDFLKSLTREVAARGWSTSRVRLFKKSGPGGAPPAGCPWRRNPLQLGPPPLHPRGCPCRRNPLPLGSPPPGSDFFKSLTREVAARGWSTSRVRLFKKSGPGGAPPAGCPWRRNPLPLGPIHPRAALAPRNPLQSDRL